MFHIGQKIKQIAENKNINAPQLAAKIGKTKQAVYDYYKKEHIDTGVLERIAIALEVDILEFFTTESNKYVVESIDIQLKYAKLESENKTLQQENSRLKDEIIALLKAKK